MRELFLRNERFDTEVNGFFIIISIFTIQNTNINMLKIQPVYYLYDPFPLRLYDLVKHHLRFMVFNIYNSEEQIEFRWSLQMNSPFSTTQKKFSIININFIKQSQQKLQLMSNFRNKPKTNKMGTNSSKKSESKEKKPLKKWNTNNIPSTVRQLPQQEQEWSLSMRNFIHDLMNDQNKIMEEMLNSSINHFTRFIDPRDIEHKNHQLIQQNQHLKQAVQKMKNILKQKLENALKKQREDLNIMMQDYIQLIQKLLKDKQNFAASIQEGSIRAVKAEKISQDLAKRLKERDCQINTTLKQKQNQIIKLKKEECKQKQIIEYHLSESKKINIEKQDLIRQNQKFKSENRDLKHKISLFQQKGLDFFAIDSKSDGSPSKIKLLLDLLLKAQEQMRRMREKIRQLGQGCEKDQLIASLQLKIQQMEQEHQDQFYQYDISMKEMLAKKDEYIQKLTSLPEIHRRQNRTN